MFVLCKFLFFHRPIFFSARDLSICNESRLLLYYTTNLIDLSQLPAYAQASLSLLTKAPDRSLRLCRIAEAEGAQTNYMRKFLEPPQKKFFLFLIKKKGGGGTQMFYFVCMCGRLFQFSANAIHKLFQVRFQTIERKRRRRR